MSAFAKWLAIALTVGLLAVGCSSDGQSSGSSSSSAEPENATSTTEELEATFPVGSSTCRDVRGGVLLYNDDLAGEANSDLLKVALESDAETLLVTWIMGAPHYPAEEAYRRHWAVTAFDQGSGERIAVLSFSPDAEDQSQRLTVADLGGGTSSPESAVGATDTIADSRIRCAFSGRLLGGPAR